MASSTNTVLADVLEADAYDGDGLSVFISARHRLFAIAYRMLGSSADAEDIVQDVWLRWQSANRSAVLDPLAFLATTTTRLAINRAQSARSRRETYMGPSLLEPVDTCADPGLGAERGEALKLAVLLLLEKLSPTERAAYVLRVAFDYPYRQIANILQIAEANCRQLVSRARKRIVEGHRAPVSSAEQQRLLVAFMDAAQKGDFAALEGLLLEKSSTRLAVGSCAQPGSSRTCAWRYAVVARRTTSRSPITAIETCASTTSAVQRLAARRLKPTDDQQQCHKTMGRSVLASTTGKLKC